MQIETGQIFYSSWGYEQTNIDFYEVVKVSKAMVTVRKIAQDATHEDMRGKCTPRVGEFIGEPIRRRPRDSYGEPTLRLTDYSFAYPWDDKPKSFTTYG